MAFQRDFEAIGRGENQRAFLSVFLHERKDESVGTIVIDQNTRANA
jgi:hypothetical protein